MNSATRFDIHWCVVPPDRSGGHGRSGCDLLALWPAPVNADECFAAAGFTDFDDADRTWDDLAEALLQRVCDALATCGPAVQRTPLLRQRLPWYRRLFRQEAPLPLLDQLQQPMHWDSLPPCVVEFGARGASLRTGEGHVIFWITLPQGKTPDPAEFVRSVAQDHPVHHTTLRWEHLVTKMSSNHSGQLV